MDKLWSPLVLRTGSGPKGVQRARLAQRAFGLSCLFALWLQSASAQTPADLAKLSSHLRMLVSGNPAAADPARRVLAVRTRGQGQQPVVGAFVRFQGDADALRVLLAQYGATIGTVVGNLATAEIPIDALARLASLPTILQIEESLQTKPNNDVSVPATGANQIWYGAGGPVAVGATNRGAMPPAWTGNTGQNVLVGIVDTGIDLNHKDFVDAAGNTRIVALWDQTAAKGTPPTTPAGYSAFAGNECTAAQINAVRQKTDLAITNSFDQTMSILQGNGTGGFAVTSTFSKGHSSVVSATGDFDLDGNMDLVTGNLDGSISWVQGNGHGGFVPQNPTTVAGSTVQITALAVGDFNRDGIPDVAAALYQANQVAILLGKGDGTFLAPAIINVGTNPTSVVVADMDGDGFVDLVVANYRDGTVSVLLGDGAGGFGAAAGHTYPVSTVPPNYDAGAFPSFLAVGDLNGDGKPDLVAADFGRNQLGGAPGANVSILLGNGDGSFGTPTSISTGHFERVVALGDFNEDGNLDIVLQSYSAFVTILLGHGDGTFSAPVDYNAGGTTGLYDGQTSLIVGDFNHDGHLDVANLVRDATPSGQFYDLIAVLLGNGSGTLGTAVTYPTGSTGNSSSLVLGNFRNTVCTEVDLNGHGTNVAGIAAGNGSDGGYGPLQVPYRYMGMAPQASLIVVKTTFDDQAVVNGVAYIESKAASLGLPVVTNLSIGGQHGPHDGTSSFESMLSGLTGNGKVVVAATGNDAASALHGDGLLSDGATALIGFSVPAGLTSSFTMELWYPGEDQFGVTIKDPTGTSCFTSPVYPGNGTPVTIQNATCGTVTVTAGPANAINGDHGVSVDISNGSNATPSGNWSMILYGSGCGPGPCVITGSFDVWAKSVCVPQGGCVALIGPPVDTVRSLTTPAPATDLVSVGSYITRTSWTSRNGLSQSAFGGNVGDLSTFSGLGPRRKCSAAVCAATVQKPDVVAPGQEIMSSYAAGTPSNSCGAGAGCLDPDGRHIVYQGTSMAAPHVSGAVALLMAKYGAMTPCQVKSSFSSARVDTVTGVTPNNNFGFGKLAIDLAIGLTPANFTVPNVMGLGKDAAEGLINTANLSLGSVSYLGSGVVPVGKVILQNPAPGPNGCGGVNLVISGIAVPDVSGNSKAAASTTLTGANLAVGPTILAASTTVPVGKVIRTKPAAGAYAGPGDFVALVIASAGKCDLNGDGAAGLSDVTQIIQEALGASAATHDLNGDGVVNVLDVQIVVTAASGGACIAQ